MSEQHEDKTISEDNSTILVVDDALDTRTMMTSLFEDDDYRVVSAADETDAFECLQRRPPDLIVMNQHQSPLDAIEAGCRIREGVQKGEEVPVIVIPSKAAEVRGVNIPLGRNVYITFWSAFRQLENLLGRLLHRRAKPAGSKI